MDIRSISSIAPQSMPGSPHSMPGMPQPPATKQSIGDPAKSEEVAGEAGEAGASSELQEAFSDFVGQTLFGSMLASMRKTVGKPAYMHGGRTEEVFQKQLDEIMVEQLTEASADEIAQPMFDLFQMQRRA